eukprot:762233-Amphidinium_carterae.1
MDALGLALVDPPELNNMLRREGHKGFSQDTVESMLEACEHHRLEQRRALQKQKLPKGPP